MPGPRTWAVVLAAGDGTRLAALTTDADGRLIPKQFCSLNGDGTLLQAAIQRAGHIVVRERVCVIVAEQHRGYWQRMLWTLPSSNVIVQPRNCGTAIGILLCVLRILERDPLARIVFLPADHYVGEEKVLAGSLQAVATLLTSNPEGLMFLGVEPEEADPGFGYIVPGGKLADGTRSVQRFVEKPESTLARQLFVNGALWNTFIFAAQAPVLLRLLRARSPEVVRQMEVAMAYDADLGTQAMALRELYGRLPCIDFSGAIVSGAESELRVLTTPACGWNDLGTPERVARSLQRLTRERRERAASRERLPSFVAAPAIINLATQHAQLGRAAAESPVSR
ncbi:MAG TPA: sugar phosphate nucleotidyltransferase [Burkholderiales bacterium]|nr:sugar phosphate nucleotidyltransferase [Burkholderiales bacterium]